MADILAVLGVLLALEIVFLGILSTWRQFFPASVERARIRVERTPWQCFWIGCIAFFILLPPVATLLLLPLNVTRIVGCFLLMAVLAFAGLGASGLAAKTGARWASNTGNTESHGAPPVHRNFIVQLAAVLWMGGMATVILLPPVTILFKLPLNLAWLIGCSLVFTILLISGLGLAVRAANRDISSQRHDSESTRPVPAFLRGGAMLGLAAGFPVIGWFIIFPITMLVSLGATVFALFRWAPAGAETAERRGMKPQKVGIAALIILWMLPFTAISTSALAFFLRGGIPLELAAGFPFIGWCIVLPVYIITVLGGTMIALSHRRRRRAIPMACTSS